MTNGGSTGSGGGGGVGDGRGDGDHQQHQQQQQQQQRQQRTASSPPVVTDVQDELQPFFQEDFDVASFSTSVIRGKMIQQQLDKLNAGIERIQKELYAQVASRHADLITQATGIQRLEDVLAMITARVEGLQKSILRIKDKLHAPYQHIAQKTRKLERMQAACELLRRTVRFLTLVSKLKQQRSGGDKDMSRAAYTLSEIQHLVADKALHGIHVIERDRAWVYETREDIEKQAREKLSRGLDHLKHQTLTTSLQVFHNLGSLKDEVDSVLQSRMLVLVRSLDSLLFLPSDLSGKHSMDSGIRAHVWDHLDRFLKQFRKLAFESRTLHLVMMKRRSQSSYHTFAQLVEPSPGGVAHRVWSEMLTTAKAAFDKTDGSNAARRVLEAGYPKMLQLFLDKWRQILDHFSADYSSDLLRAEQSQLRDT
ncbi:hypothetical protein PTSG_09567 [Salpingoeca rosetta]|uniref:Conserved oligomeric Golgi complex subunit 5 n=1 Tax=Salpingoeca rosetta (strain ATCC 50818 / BSB-021) TaxID=946362 RepID=F2ULD3_SALR5|nr:uncharacterized protein PTSG_09567 [Salpingoeca rosetta]EGD77932.1 hypothetical protein PTSG_09567 [Salpingoeca rosetta]|eukprot:XP_004989995.1 hypothetical protein PTSG_09567 [Salpingoeca rosetta]